MVIVDTSVVIDFLANRPTLQTIWLDAQLGRTRFGVTPLILCEVLQGVRDDGDFWAFQVDLDCFEVLESESHELALASAQNYRMLRKKGITIRNTIDCLIATFCIKGGHELLHNDRDFDGFENLLGLQVVHPL